MTDALIVLAHPDESSFCHALAATSQRRLHEIGVSVEFRDLYREGFDPLLTASELSSIATEPQTDDAGVGEHQAALAAAQALVVVHPNWWGKPPAMMAGWMDRVLAPGVMYRLDRREGEPTPLLRLQHLIVLNTSDTPADRERECFGDPLDAIWRRCVGDYVPTARFRRETYGPIGPSTHQERATWLDELTSVLPSADRFG